MNRPLIVCPVCGSNQAYYWAWKDAGWCSVCRDIFNPYKEESMPDLDKYYDSLEEARILSSGITEHEDDEDWRGILDNRPKRRIIGDTDDFSLHDHLKEQFPYGHERFTELCIEELALHSKKNYDYAHGGNPLGNFTRVANILSNYPGLKLTPPVVALVYAMKQLDAVLWQLSQGYEGTVEGIDDKAQDIHVYIKLFRILLEEA